MDLKDTICLITGGTRGIGAATAVTLAECGAHVALASRRLDDQARAVSRQIEALGRKCLLISADLAKPEDARRCVSHTTERLGGIDVLVHSAGGPVPGGLMEITDQAWYDAFDVHVHAIFHLCRAAVPLMKPRKQGAIILVSSTAGLRALASNLAYQAVKGAIPHLTRALARELAGDNIRVNCVAPGVVRTEFHATMTEEQRTLNLQTRIPLKREGEPSHVATLIRELVTNDYITGETFVIDGGLTMRIC